MLLGLLRFLVSLLVIYFVLTIAREILRALGIAGNRGRKKSMGFDDRQSQNARQEKEVYKDVQDAKFTEIPPKSDDHA